MKSVNLKVLSLLIIICSLASCKKFKDGIPDIQSSVIQNDVNSWLHSIKSQISDTVHKLTLEKIKSLDYSKSKVVKYPNSKANVFILKTNWQSLEYTEYLVFAKIEERYQTLGYTRLSKKTTEEELAIIEKLFTEKRVSPDVKIMFYGLNKRHLTTYIGMMNGGLKCMKVLPIENNRSKTQIQARQSDCTDWYLVTTYTYPDGSQYTEEIYITTICNGGSGCETLDPNGQNMECINPAEGGGGHGWNEVLSPNEDGLENICENSFRFQKHIDVDPSTNVGGWQIAGIRNIHMNIRNLTTGELTMVQLPTMYFGLPIIRSGGDFYSTTRASEIAAAAVDYAEQRVMSYYHSLGSGIINFVDINRYYRQQINQFMQNFGGSATLTPGSNIGPVQITSAQYGIAFGIGC